MPHTPENQFILDVLNSNSDPLTKWLVLQSRGHIPGALVASVQLIHPTGPAGYTPAPPAEAAPAVEASPMPVPGSLATKTPAPAPSLQLQVDPPADDPAELHRRANPPAELQDHKPDNTGLDDGPADSIVQPKAPRQGPTPYEKKVAELGPIEDREWILPAEAAGMLGVTLEEAQQIRKDEDWATKPLGIGRALLWSKADVQASLVDMKDSAPAAIEKEAPADENPADPEPAEIPPAAEPDDSNNAPAAGLRPRVGDPQPGDDGVVEISGDLWVTAPVAASCLNMSTSRFMKSLPKPGTVKPIRNQESEAGTIYCLEDIKRSTFYRVDGRMGF